MDLPLGSSLTCGPVKRASTENELFDGYRGMLWEWRLCLKRGMNQYGWLHGRFVFRNRRRLVEIILTSITGDCDAACSMDPHTVKCSNAASPYCQSWSCTNPNVQQYACGTDSASNFAMVETTYTGEFSATSNYNIASGSMSMTLPMDKSTAMASDIGAAVGAMGLMAMPSSSMSMNIAASISVSTVIASMSLPSTTMMSSTPTAAPVKASTPVGAIVGAVFGGKAMSPPFGHGKMANVSEPGLAVVGAILGVIVHLILRRRKESPQGAPGHGSQYGPPASTISYWGAIPTGGMITSCGPDKVPAQQEYVVPPGSTPPPLSQTAHYQNEAPRMYSSWFPSRHQEEGIIHEAPHAEPREEVDT